MARVEVPQDHLESLYQDITDAYQGDRPEHGKKPMTRVIDTLNAGLPAGLDELRTLGRTLHRGINDILAHFDHPGTSNRPTAAAGFGPHPLHSPLPTRRRRIQTANPISSVRSPFAKP